MPLKQAAVSSWELDIYSQHYVLFHMHIKILDNIAKLETQAY